MTVSVLCAIEFPVCGRLGGATEALSIGRMFFSLRGGSQTCRRPPLSQREAIWLQWRPPILSKDTLTVPRLAVACPTLFHKKQSIRFVYDDVIPR